MSSVQLSSVMAFIRLTFSFCASSGQAGEVLQSATVLQVQSALTGAERGAGRLPSALYLVPHRQHEEGGH